MNNTGEEELHSICVKFEGCAIQIISSQVTLMDMTWEVKRYWAKGALDKMERWKIEDEKMKQLLKQMING